MTQLTYRRHPLVNRTSPTGQPFVGTCAACGITGITFDRLVTDECANARQITQEEALIEAIAPRGVQS